MLYKNFNSRWNFRASLLFLAFTYFLAVRRFGFSCLPSKAFYTAEQPFTFIICINLFNFLLLKRSKRRLPSHRQYAIDNMPNRSGAKWSPSQFIWHSTFINTQRHIHHIAGDRCDLLKLQCAERFDLLLDAFVCPPAKCQFVYVCVNIRTIYGLPIAAHSLPSQQQPATAPERQARCNPAFPHIFSISRIYALFLKSHDTVQLLANFFSYHRLRLV